MTLLERSCVLALISTSAVWKLTLAALVLLVMGGCRHNGTGESKPAAAETPELSYAQHCLGCHGAKGEGAMGSNIQSLKRTTDQIVAVIANGEGKMPPFRGHLSDAEMQALAAYIKRFRFSK